MTKTNTIETQSNFLQIPEGLMRTLKITAAVGTAALAAFLYEHNNTRNYGYHPNRNPAPPTYIGTHNGINPADIVRGGNSK